METKMKTQRVIEGFWYQRKNLNTLKSIFHKFRLTSSNSPADIGDHYAVRVRVPKENENPELQLSVVFFYVTISTIKNYWRLTECL